jgi:hypothetical protein
MDVTLIDLATLVAYGAIAVDFLLQIHRVWVRKSSADISVAGSIIRCIAALIITVKLLYVGDVYVSLGQGVVVALLMLYVVLVIRYRAV